MTRDAADRPTAAFVLSLIGGIFYLLFGIVIVALAAVIGGLAKIAGYGAAGLAVAAVGGIGGIGLICGIVIIIGAVMMNSSNRFRVRAASIVVLVFTIIGAIFTLGGLVVGFILALIGSILGLTWKPTASMVSAPLQTQPA